MSENALILKNTASLLVGRLLSRAFQFVMLIYAARVLGVGQFGIFSFAFAVMSLLAVLVDPGLSAASVLEMSRNRAKTATLLGTNLVLRFGLTALALIAVLVFGIASGRDAVAISTILLLVVAAGLDSATAAFGAVFQARERMASQAVLLSVSGILTATIGLAVLHLFHDLLLFTLAFTAGALIRASLHAFICIRRFDRPLWDPHGGALFELLRKGIPFGLISIFVAIYYYVDTVILAAFWGDEMVGWYNAAYRLLEAPLFISSAFTTALFPAASRLCERDSGSVRDLIAQAFPRALCAGLAIAVPIAFFSREIIDLCYGERYAAAAAVLPPLIFSVAIIFPSTMLGTTIRAIGRQRISAWVTGLGALFNVILNLIVIPHYGYQGAAWTTLATEAAVIATYGILTARYLGSFVSIRELGRSMAVILCMLVFLSATHRIGMWGQLSGYALLFVPVLVGWGVVSLNDLRSCAMIARSHRERVPA